MQSRKKILYVVESFGSGVFSFLVDLINEIDNDYEITIAYGVRKETPLKFKEYFNKDIKFIKIENFTREINIKKDVKAFFEIRKIIKEIKPNIIHLHSSKAGIIGRLAVNGNKLKMFYNPHGFSFLKEDDSKLKRFIYKGIEKGAAIINRKCIVIGCSKGEYEEAKKLNKNAICINNGVNIEKLKEETKDLKEKEIDYNNLKICTVGRIGYQKNPELFNKIAMSFPEIQFTWIGDGELKEKLTSKNIIVTGWKERKEVLKILNNNDIFMLVSLWEGLPISLLEAMYMKKICIVSNVIGNRDVVKDNENGFIAKEETAYNNIIEKLIKNKEKDLILGKKAYKNILEKNSLTKMQESYIDIYNNER